MQDYNTIIGVIQMRQNNCSFSVIEARYHIGSGTAQRILKRYEASGMTLDELRTMGPSAVEELIYPPQNLQRKDVVERRILSGTSDTVIEDVAA